MQNHQSQLINAFVYIYTSVKDVQVEVLDKQLIRWKRDQQLAGNGYQMNPGFLDTLQEVEEVSHMACKIVTKLSD